MAGESEDRMTRPITDAEVEAVARAFCKCMGFDPEMFGTYAITDQGEPRTVKAWELHTGAAREAIAWRLAVNEVIG
jgi:hypothetical protein